MQLDLFVTPAPVAPLVTPCAPSAEPFPRDMTGDMYVQENPFYDSWRIKPQANVTAVVGEGTQIVYRRYMASPERKTTGTWYTSERWYFNPDTKKAGYMGLGTTMIVERSPAELLQFLHSLVSTQTL